MERLNKLEALKCHPYYKPYFLKISKTVLGEMVTFLGETATLTNDEYALKVLRFDYDKKLKPKKHAVLVNEILLVCK